MKKTLVLSMILLAFSVTAAADSILFKDGMRVDAPDVWVDHDEVKCKIGSIVFGYPKADVVRIEKGRSGADKAAASVLKVHKEGTRVPEKESASRQKETAGPEKKVAKSGQKPAAFKKKAIVSKKETSAPKKESVASKKKNSPGAVAPQYSSIPSFKEIINEDDNNPPAYIKRRRVLLVPRGLAKTQIRALLLSYEKKMRNELKARKAKYKLIVVWAYDDFERADEGAAGWVGKISNGQKTGELSEAPELVFRGAALK